MVESSGRPVGVHRKSLGGAPVDETIPVALYRASAKSDAKMHGPAPPELPGPPHSQSLLAVDRLLDFTEQLLTAKPAVHAGKAIMDVVDEQVANVPDAQRDAARIVLARDILAPMLLQKAERDGLNLLEALDQSARGLDVGRYYADDQEPDGIVFGVNTERFMAAPVRGHMMVAISRVFVANRHRLKPIPQGAPRAPPGMPTVADPSYA